MTHGLEEARAALEELYAEKSKHSQYQSLPQPLAERLNLNFEINEDWRGDRPRYQCILDWIPEQQRLRIVDVGANTGFFSLSLAHDRPLANITACEPNPAHARIIRLLARTGEYKNVDVSEQSWCMDSLTGVDGSDFILHLNILHHAGHDFDKDKLATPEDFVAYAADYLSRLKGAGTRLIFQMGYNWGGNKSLPLVAPDNQAGKFQFTRELFEKSGWDVDSVAFASYEANLNRIQYKRFPFNAVLRSPDQLQTWLKKHYGTRIWSEFYQRPIWFCCQR